jgi:hypothetical protein
LSFPYFQYIETFIFKSQNHINNLFSYLTYFYENDYVEVDMESFFSFNENQKQVWKKYKKNYCGFDSESVVSTVQFVCTKQSVNLPSEIDILIDPTSDKNVSFNDFQTFFDWFGSEKMFSDSIKNCGQILSFNYFWGSLTTFEANVFLKNSKFGSFILRFDEYIPGKYIISVNLEKIENIDIVNIQEKVEINIIQNDNVDIKIIDVKDDDKIKNENKNNEKKNENNEKENIFEIKNFEENSNIKHYLIKIDEEDSYYLQFDETKKSETIKGLIELHKNIFKNPFADDEIRYKLKIESSSYFNKITKETIKKEDLSSFRGSIKFDKNDRKNVVINKKFNLVDEYKKFIFEKEFFA